MGLDGAIGVVRVAQLEHLALAELGQGGRHQPCGLLAHGGRLLRRPGEDVVAGQQRLVESLAGVDGGPAPARGGGVQDVVVDERADLHQLDGGRRGHDPLVEDVAQRGTGDGEQGPEPLAARLRHADGRRPEQGIVLAERRRDPFVDGRQAVIEVGDAEHPGEVVDAELALEHGCGTGRGAVHRPLPGPSIRPI